MTLSEECKKTNYTAGLLQKAALLAPPVFFPLRDGHEKEGLLFFWFRTGYMEEHEKVPPPHGS